MENIIFIAPPAAGKGTISSLLEKNQGYVHISTGDMLREAINSGSELGIKVKNIMDQGQLVDDDLMISLIKDKLISIDGKPFILDGFPRTLNQAQQLNNIFEKNNINNFVVISLEIDYDIALKRSLGRVTCSKCGLSFNIYIDAMKPKQEGVCDGCGSILNRRDDDNEESFKVRFDTFLENNKDILDYYNKLDRLSTIDVNRDSDLIYKDILEIVND